MHVKQIVFDGLCKSFWHSEASPVCWMIIYKGLRVWNWSCLAELCNDDHMRTCMRVEATITVCMPQEVHDLSHMYFWKMTENPIWIFMCWPWRMANSDFATLCRQVMEWFFYIGSTACNHLWRAYQVVRSWMYLHILSMMGSTTLMKPPMQLWRRCATCSPHAAASFSRQGDKAEDDSQAE